ncbi:MAG TPA: transposase [bacterium]|nr:transposase [bacterium]
MVQSGHNGKRVRRYNIPGSFHELTFSCYRNMNLLKSERACSNLARAIIQACEKLDYRVLAYVFMPDHVHLLVKPLKEEYSISVFLKSVKQSTARNELKYLREHEPDKARLLLTHQKYGKYRFWQDGGGYDRNIIKESTIEKSVNYIHENPVRKGLAGSAVDWKWSSASDWIEDRKGIIPVEKG